MNLKVRHIYVSPGHNYFGHHGRPPGAHPISEVREAECVPGRGLRGDRFCGEAENHKGQLTLFSLEVFEQMRRERGLDPEAVSPSALRRNVVVEGGDLNALVGRRFTLQGVELEGVEECRPCYWMDRAVGAGTEAWLKGRGGLRCRILTAGRLRVE